MTSESPTLLTGEAQQSAMAVDRDLFRLSNLVDVLRDSAHTLLSAHPTSGDLEPLRRTLTARYTDLRALLADVVTDDDRDYLHRWTDPLPDTAGVAEIFTAAAGLAKVVDVVLQTHAFVATRVDQRNQIALLLDAAGVSVRAAAPDTPAPTPRSGGYL